MKRVNFPMDIDEKMEDLLREQMQEQLPLPQVVEAAKASAYARIRAQAETQRQNREAAAPSARKERQDKPAPADTFRGTHARAYTRPRRRPWKTLGSIAAAAAVFSGVCITHPAFAAKVPLVGHVFAQIGQSLGFQGDFERYAVPMEETETLQVATGEALPETSYVQSIDGMTVTLSEQYCNASALYLSFILETEDPFPETMLDQNGQPILSLLRSTLQVDYNPDPIMPDAYLDGSMVDDHTYAGVLRISLDETLRRAVIDEAFTEGEELVDAEAVTYETLQLPEQFHVHLQIPQVIGTLPESNEPEMPDDIRQAYEDAMSEAGLDPAPEAYESYTQEQQELEHQLFTQMWNQYYERYPDAGEYPNLYENWWVDGPWTFDFDVSVNHEDTISALANADEQCAIGAIELTKTPFELTVSYDYTKAAAVDCVVVVLDAQGEPLGYGHHGGSIDEHPIAGHDVSSVTVFVCDYLEYMDELKGYYYSPEAKESGQSYQQLLKERSLYYETVTF